MYSVRKNHIAKNPGKAISWVARVLPYVVLFILFARPSAAALRMPEPVTARTRPRLTSQRPSLPAVVRRPFLLTALGVTSSWSIGRSSSRSELSAGIYRGQ